MATKNIKKILLNKYGNNYVANIEDIENRITQNSSNLETAKQELSSKCDTVLSDAKTYTDTKKNEAIQSANSYTDQEKAKLFNSTNGTFTGQEYFRDVNNSLLRFNGGNTHDGGASLMLHGKNENGARGHFDLVACTKEDASDSKQLIGMPDGRLTWNSKNIVRSVNGALADENGNVQLGSIGAITGKIEWFAFNTPPEGYLVCNGANVSRETYADLFAIIGTAFGSGDGSTTFTLPDLRDRYIIGANTNALGKYVAEQLPNIRGTIGGVMDIGTGGAFYNGGGTYSVGPGGYGFHQTGMSAGNYNSTYRDNGHVYPLSLALLPCIKY